MLCDNCHKNPASVHVSSVGDETLTKKHLCADCYKATPLAEMAAAGNFPDIFCEYCGDPAFSGGTDVLALITGVQKNKFMCLTCNLEHKRFFSEITSRPSDDQTSEKQIARLREINDQVDAHMKKWLSQNK